jgi:hypothetical protein
MADEMSEGTNPRPIDALCLIRARTQPCASLRRSLVAQWSRQRRCSVAPIRCSDVPMDFDLDQPTGQLSGSTLSSAMTLGTPLVMVG